METLVRKALVQGAVAVVAGWCVLAAFVVQNVAHLRDLLSGSPDAPLALGLLVVFFALTFGSVGVGASVITAHRDEDTGAGDPGSGRDMGARVGRGGFARGLAPIPARAQSRR